MVLEWVGYDYGRVSLLSRCQILASAEHSGCIWQHQWQPMLRSHWQNLAAVWGDAAIWWLVNSRWWLYEKICNFVPFNIYCITQWNANITKFCFTVYVASLHVVNQQKVCLLPEVVKPSMAVYDTVAECDLSRQNSRTCAEAVPRGQCDRYSYPRAVGAIQILAINLTQLSLFTNNKRSCCASVKQYRCQPPAAEVWRQASAIGIGWVNWHALWHLPQQQYNHYY